MNTPDTEWEKETQVKPRYEWNHITKDDLKEDCVLKLDNGLILRYTGEVDTHSNNEHLFKNLYSPFATTKWIVLTVQKISELKVNKLIPPTQRGIIRVRLQAITPQEHA